MKKLLLIDAHALIHRMFHAMAPLTGPNGEPVGAVYGLAGLILKIKQEMNPDYIAACFDRPEMTFRKEAYPQYKAHRAPTDPDLISQFAPCREVFDKFKIKIFELPGCEADDLIGTLATTLKSNPDLKILMLSGDRDLLQLVDNDKVVATLIKSGRPEPVEYDEAKIKEEYGLTPKQLIDLKALVGDASDNIPGVTGLGPKGATPLLQDFGTLEGVYENLMIIKPTIAKKLEEQQESAFLSKRLATIKCDCSLFVDSLEDLRALPLDAKALSSYFTKMGFASLMNRISV